MNKVRKNWNGSVMILIAFSAILYPILISTVKLKVPSRHYLRIFIFLLSIKFSKEGENFFHQTRKKQEEGKSAPFWFFLFSHLFTDSICHPRLCYFEYWWKIKAEKRSERNRALKVNCMGKMLNSFNIVNHFC